MARPYSIELLAGRIESLDSYPGQVEPKAVVRRFVELWQHIADTGFDRQNLGRVSAAEADEIVARCESLSLLDGVVPGLTRGPLDLSAQYWIATNTPNRISMPAQGRFVDARRLAGMPPETKPSSFGLFTSSGFSGTAGMWSSYLELNWGSSLFPLPWRTWQIQLPSHARVLTIASAHEWVEMVLRHGRESNHVQFPDWQSLAVGFDGIHLTLRAIAAIQGLPLHANGKAIATPYWDVESTIWLSWVFQSAEERVELAGDLPLPRSAGGG